MTPFLLLSAVLAQPPADGEPAKLTVSPAVVPVPALKYELLPPARLKSPGNAAVGYYRAALLRPAPPKDPAEAKRQEDTVLEWEEATIQNLPPSKIKEYLKGWQLALRELDDAARTEKCDWQQAGKLKPEDIGSLLPAVQVDREMIRYLALRTRLELAEGRLDDAVYSIQTGLQTGKNVAEGPSLIQALVGIALTNVVLGRVEEFVQQPGAPNLYWALAALPRPLLDPRPALDGEFRLTTSAIPGLADLEKGPVPAETADKVFDATVALLALDEGKDNPLAGKAGRAVYLTYHLASAKKELVARGWKPITVDAMPAAQVVLIRTAAIYREIWDDQAKLFFAPQPFARADFARVKEKVQAVRKEAETDPLTATFALVFPAVEKVHGAFARTERKLAALQAVEAIRLHAAATGKLPAALDAVTAAPVPVDPGTGKPFVYTYTDGVATLSGPAPAGEPPVAPAAIRYEIRLRSVK